MHQHVSAHLKECGEEGREDKKKKTPCNFSAPLATWKPRSITCLNRSSPPEESGQLQRSYEEEGMLQAGAHVPQLV